MRDGLADAGLRRVRQPRPPRTSVSSLHGSAATGLELEELRGALWPAGRTRADSRPRNWAGVVRYSAMISCVAVAVDFGEHVSLAHVGADRLAAVDDHAFDERPDPRRAVLSRVTRPATSNRVGNLRPARRQPISTPADARGGRARCAPGAGPPEAPAGGARLGPPRARLAPSRTGRRAADAASEEHVGRIIGVPPAECVTGCGGQRSWLSR